MVSRILFLNPCREGAGSIQASNLSGGRTLDGHLPIINGKSAAFMFVCVAAMMEGYGDDRDSTLEAFPFSQQLPKMNDEDAEMRRKLKHMGKGE